MLLNFSFQNFRSYRDAQQFSMERSKPAQKRDSATWGHNNVSVATGVYGGNASGKVLSSTRFDLLQGISRVALAGTSIWLRS